VIPIAIVRPGLAASLLLLLATACASVPLADPQQDAQAKRFAEPAQDNGALYVYRSGLMGFARPVGVSIAGGVNAELAPDTYLRLEGPPGPVELSCKVGGHRGGQQIEIVAGRTRYVEVSMTMGAWEPGCQVAEVSPDRGQAAVLSAKRVNSQGQ
jgi:hypothetical protein